MNAKTAKKLRKIAFGMVVAAEQRSAEQALKKDGAAPKPIARVSYVINRAGTVSVAQNTWKGAYKALKKGLKKESKGSAFANELSTVAARKNAVATA